MDMARIILKANTTLKQINCDTVKLTPEALSVLQRLQLRSGLSARQIVSDILLQAEYMVQVEEGDER
jgi:hypothetical protein